MTKKDKELLKEAADLLQEVNALMGTLYERLYQRAGDAWQFKPKIDELARLSTELIARMDVVPGVNPEPESGENAGGMEVAGTFVED